jgi:serine/threonine-protein kinase HipA
VSTEIDVFLEGLERPIGRSTGDDHGTLTFGYDASADRPISLSLPLRDEPYGDVETRAFVDNLLQENASLDDVMARFGIDRGDVAGLLFHLGRDCPGALSCVPAGDGPGKQPGDLATDHDRLSQERLVAILRALRDRGRLPAETRDPSPLAGVQGKIAVAKLPDGGFGLPRVGTGAPTTHVLKTPRRGEEALVLHEHRLLRIAAATLGGGVAATGAMEIGGVHALLVTRFDRRIDAGRVHRIHQEDFAQALGLPKRLKYEREGRPDRAFTAAAVGDLLGRTASPARARLDFFRATILNLALGNTDNHAKNHALLYEGRSPVLSPLYDVVPVLLDSRVTHDFSFRVGKACRTDDLARGDLGAFAAAIGLAPRRARNERRIVQIAAEVLEGAAGSIPALGGPRLKLLGDMIAHQVSELAGALELPVDVPERDALILRGGGFAAS